ncbi:22587_t:CDS:2 [Cetraspora pellucida]|uniref:22587_t:CDS:1 n=1 Tax=Cetraspora pellucida TaxID=1433469 RepID=A0A9N9FHJ1_9GLOM|nr:22587_t:CDS:2 [Cetraspora pellucida]
MKCFNSFDVNTEIISNKKEKKKISDLVLDALNLDVEDVEKGNNGIGVEKAEWMGVEKDEQIDVGKDRQKAVEYFQKATNMENDESTFDDKKSEKFDKTHPKLHNQLLNNKKRKTIVWMPKLTLEGAIQVLGNGLKKEEKYQLGKRKAVNNSMVYKALRCLPTYGLCVFDPGGKSFLLFDFVS